VLSIVVEWRSEPGRRRESWKRRVVGRTFCGGQGERMKSRGRVRSIYDGRYVGWSSRRPAKSLTGGKREM